MRFLYKSHAILNNLSFDKTENKECCLPGAIVKVTSDWYNAAKLLEFLPPLQVYLICFREVIYFMVILEAVVCGVVNLPWVILRFISNI